MKKLNKVLVVVLLVTMLFAIFMNSANAVVDQLIDTTKKGSLTIHKYEVGNIGDYTTVGTGNQTTITQEDNTRKPLEGASFTIYKVADGETSTDVDTVTKTEISSGTTDENGEIVFSELELGRYLVVETDAPENVNEMAAPFLVDIPVVNSTGTAWNYDVHAYPKNQTAYGVAVLTKTDATTDEAVEGAVFELYKEGNDTPRATLTTDENGLIIVENLPLGNYYFIEKTAANGYIVDNVSKLTFTITESSTVTPVTDGDGNVTGYSFDGKEERVAAENVKFLTIDKFVTSENNKSETQSIAAATTETEKYVTWIIKSRLPEDFKNYTNYTITETLENELTFVPDSLTVVLNGDTQSATPEEVQYSFTPDERELTLTINPGDVDAGYLVIQYQTIVNTDALNKLGENIENTATLTYSVNTSKTLDETTGEVTTTDATYVATVDNNPYVHTSGYKFKKVDTAGNALAGAEFKITKSENPTGTDYIQAYDAAGNLTDTFTSDSDGYVVINGLADGTYYLVETKAPVDATGRAYNLLREAQQIEITNATHNYAEGRNIENKMGLELPATGGIGTLVVTVIGIGIIVAGIVLLRKKDEEK